MKIDKNEFFREATLLICGKLEIEAAMADCIRYLSQYMPADMMSLELFSPDFSSMRILAEATSEGSKKTDRLTPMPQEAIDFMAIGREHVEKRAFTGAILKNRVGLNVLTQARFF